MNDQVKLSQTERNRFRELEDIISEGLETFIEVGKALAEIKDKGFYREDFKSFESYCTSIWDFSRSYGDRLIRSAEIFSDLEKVVPIGTILPGKENHIRPLAKLETPTQRAEVWQEVVNTAPDGVVTAKHVEAVVEKRVAHTRKIMSSSESDEYYTPSNILDAIYGCLKVIDLDPCSNSAINPNVIANQHYTLIDDGLTKTWIAKTLFMNPPHSNVKAWVEKLIKEFTEGNIQEAIALLKSDTSTQWFQLIRDYPICLINHRLVFVGSDNSAPFPSLLVYLGNNSADFYHTFKDFGDIWQRIEII